MSRQKIAPNLQLLAVECVEHVYGDAAGKVVRSEILALLAAADALAFGIAEMDARMADFTRRGMVIWEETEALKRARRAHDRLRRLSGPRRKG